ncbi:MAG: hypothetical protein KF808_00320 [Cryobacterium sp.]|nr:hypothetical protein [Cryobacterium sp.]
MSSAPRSISPAGDFVYDCITEKGWNVELEWDGSVVADSSTTPKEQLELLSADLEECTRQASEKFTVSKSQLPELYEAELKTLECLQSNGFSVLSDPPSKQVFIDTYDSEHWMAYSAIDVASMSEKEWKRVNLACPQPLLAFDGSFE